MNIHKVAVIGAGVMGASIAAHISNAGIPVYLLDIVPKLELSSNRNTIAETAIEKLLKAQPAPFMHKNNARLITAGNIEDHLHWLADVDWVIEAVIEKPAIKKSLYEKLEAVCGDDCVISSNTSTLPLWLLTQEFPERFKQRFMITHFFNPPRYMRLLELVTGSETHPELVAAIKEFADSKLGKECVTCKDTAGFIANRIGIYWLQCGLLEAINLGLSVEQADAALLPFGIPKTGIFGLLDLVGLDLIPSVLASMKQALPPNDAFQLVSELPPLMTKMISEGYTGRKGKGGFYRLSPERVKESINLQTGEYSRSENIGDRSSPQASTLQNLLSSDDSSSLYAWRVLSKTLTYAASLIPCCADDLVSIDVAMREGYHWQLGIFELLDSLGIAWFTDKLRSENQAIPPLLANNQQLYQADSFVDLSGHYQPIPRATGVLLLSDIKRQSSAVLSNASASLWDIGDGVACLEFHSKMNTLDMDSLALIQQSISKISDGFVALVIHNEAKNFSAGANLNLLVQAIQHGDWAAVEQLVIKGQQTYHALKVAPFPVVGAPSGLALGGGCEVLLHCDAIQAHAELYMGLVEVGVGLIPAWGGCKEYLHRWQTQAKLPKGPVPAVVKAFETIGLAKVSGSALEAKELLFLSASDGITMNKQRLLADAKTKALSLVSHYTAPESYTYKLAGKTLQATLAMGIKSLHALGKATDYDRDIAEKLAEVLSGADADIKSPLTEIDLLALELHAFVTLTKQAGTLARLEHLLKTGKPLRN
ncbi:MAG: 3-hydroxyacyl-CoA dehydrogenase/enoyl-CoA hydratase family protein [Methylococcales bacterium]|nr:3-hydroxyacyl-CoA dehydrogenase/enoyl-CoA hydratase family protein [Methylococcales bacterium]